MAEKDINIEYLPEWILEEIFSYLRDKRVLRLVSKNFKHIVDNSPKLMSNYWLKIKTEELDDSNNEITCFYQNLAVEYENWDVLKINKYKWAKHVKSIKLECREPIFFIFDLLQSVIFSSDNLQEIYIDVLKADLRFKLKSGIQKPTFKSLKKLSLYNSQYGFELSSNVIDLFTDSPNLKKLSISGISFDFTSLIENTVWKLEELYIYRLAVSIEQFLEKHKDTLKVLKIGYVRLNWNSDAISKKLPNLEILHFQYFNDFNENSETVVPNYNLRVLSLSNFHIDSKPLKELLLQYNNIERLYVGNARDIKFNNLMLSNLKHIRVTRYSSELLCRLKMENLKSLTFIKGQIDLNILKQTPAENLRNVETLKVMNEDVTAIIGFFPALKHLFLLSKNRDIKDEFLDKILASSDLKSINIIESCWKIGKTPLEYLSSVGNEKLVIKLYTEVSEMIEDVEFHYLVYY